MSSINLNLRYYVKLQAVPSLTARGYAIFNQSIFQAVSGDTREALLQAIRSDRDGEANFSDGDIVKGVVSIFIELGACVASGRDAEVLMIKFRDYISGSQTLHLEGAFTSGAQHKDKMHAYTK